VTLGFVGAHLDGDVATDPVGASDAADDDAHDPRVSAR
jgi:hypothetical protein